MSRRMLRLCLASLLVIVMTVPATASAGNRKAKARTKISQAERWRKAKAVREWRLDPAEREGAAARMALQERQVAGRLTALGVTAAAIEPTQGGIPDYFGDANWAFSPPLAKFVDSLPGLGPDAANNLQQYIPVAVPDTTSYPGSDYYEIGVVQFKEQLHSDLPPTTLRGYVQLNDPANPVTRDASGTITAWPQPHYLGPFISARKDRPVRVKFTNLLPKGAEGDLFLPTDTTVMGAGMGPLGEAGGEYTQNRATLHLHGGTSPWISDGTPHQWITPAGEDTPYPKGVSVKNVPDMEDPGDGSQTFFYTNQQSARLMFYHDHSLGITRLNVYAGEAAGYAIGDETEDALVASGVIPTDTVPLIIQDKSFVDSSTVLKTDPTWNWGTGELQPDGTRPPVHGDLWYPHVYSPAQNPADLSGMNAFGRWHYGPWFWPPTTNIANPPIPNPYYDPINAPWENETIPAAPNPSMAGEAFMDTMMVNGTVFPYTELKPKPYRFRILNAASDRFVNLQLYVADDTTMSADGRTNTEVKMVPASANPTWPADWPTDNRDGGVPEPASAGPEWIQFANEGGLLPKPAVIPQQPVTWNGDPTTFNMGNVDLHSLLVAPAERADVVVDLSQYRGKTLILYNDAPAAFPARDPRLDYYTGAEDLSATGGYGVDGHGPEVGFGPNTRTVMQIRVADEAPAPSFDTTALSDAFASTVTTPGAFAASQNPIIVPEARYNDAYNKVFPADPFSRIFDFKKTFKNINDATLTVNYENKAIQDEMGEAFDLEYGRMSGKLGLELPGTNAGNQNFVLQNFTDPITEKVKMEFEPLAPVQGDGTQIWKITHNGVDTHPIHFHLFDVQVLNRVGWDNGVRPPDDNELGWKDTVRVSPLEDTIVAFRPVLPKTPFGIPDSMRYLDPTMPPGSTQSFTNIDPKTGQPITPPVTNEVVNFGWEYVWHCHILSHEEMDMMRPISAETTRVAPTASVASIAKNGTTVDLSWTDPTPASAPSTWGNPRNEIGFKIERATLAANGTWGAYSVVGGTLANQTSYNDATANVGTTTYRYRIVSWNAVGEARSNVVAYGPPPTAPSNLVASKISQATVTLNWTDNANNENGFVIQRSTNGVNWADIGTVGANVRTYTDNAPRRKTVYYYRVRGFNDWGVSAYTPALRIVTK